MESMATPVLEREPEQIIDGEGELDPLSEVRGLIQSGKLSEAFFVARRLAAEGVAGAIEVTVEIRREIGDER